MALLGSLLQIKSGVQSLAQGHTQQCISHEYTLFACTLNHEVSLDKDDTREGCTLAPGKVIHNSSLRLECN